MQRTEENYKFLGALTKERDLEFIMDLSIYIIRAIVKHYNLMNMGFGVQ